MTKHKGVVDSIALTSSVHVSVLSTLFAKELLGSSELSPLIQCNKKRLRDAYIEVTGFLKNAGIEYFPCKAAVTIFCRLAPNATSAQEEMAAFHKYTEAGVSVAPGLAYHVTPSQRGWMRISFAVSAEERKNGLSRVHSVYNSLR